MWSSKTVVNYYITKLTSSRINLLRNISESKKLFVLSRKGDDDTFAIRKFYEQKRNFFRNKILFATIPYKLTDIGEGITEVVIKEWFVKEGDFVSQFDNICEVQSDKASVTITSRYDGVIKKIHYKIDETAYVGKPLIDIETDENKEKKEEEDSKNETFNKLTMEIFKTDQKTELERKDQDAELKKSKTIREDDKVLCIPAARKLAKDRNVNLFKIRGTGNHGQITEKDVLDYLNSSFEKVSDPISSNVSNGNDRREEVIPFTAFQNTMFKTMTAALKIPHMFYFEQFSASKVLNLMKEINENSIERIGTKVTLTAFLVKAFSNGLKKYPIINASINEKDKNIIIKHYHNIGVAMDTEAGLAVPVIKNVHNRNIDSIAKELERLVDKGKKGSFKLDDLTDGTFTISNIGSIGGTYAGPVILSPQVSIVAIGTAKPMVVFNEKIGLIKDLVLHVSISADHRILDGATVARFINETKSEIENPQNLMQDSTLL